MTEIDAEALKEHCGNCEERHIHTSHGRCLGCLHRGEQRVAERLPEETGEPVGTFTALSGEAVSDSRHHDADDFTSDVEIPELDELESVQ